MYGDSSRPVSYAHTAADHEDPWAVRDASSPPSNRHDFSDSAVERPTSPYSGDRYRIPDSMNDGSDESADQSNSNDDKHSQQGPELKDRRQTGTRVDEGSSAPKSRSQAGGGRAVGYDNDDEQSSPFDENSWGHNGMDAYRQAASEQRVGSGLPTSISTFRGFADGSSLGQGQTASTAGTEPALRHLRQEAAQIVGSSSSGSNGNGNGSSNEEDQEDVIVLLRPELEGLIFKYNSYTIIRRPAVPSSSPRGPHHRTPSQLLTYSSRDIPNSKLRQQRGDGSDSRATDLPGKSTVRRYSDFAWLNDMLLKRYPFRLIPLLPPKRFTIPVAGGHLTSAKNDDFIERRRRGLQRYLKAIVAHPVLVQDDLVKTFFTEKQSFAEWRASKTNLSTEEEAFIQPPPSSRLSSIPQDATSKFELTSAQTPAMVEKWTALTTLFERIAKRMEVQGLDYARLASMIESLEETNQATFKPPSASSSSPRSSPSATSSQSHSVSRRISSVHRDFSGLCNVRSKSLLETHLEDLKTQRDLWLSFRELLNRHKVLAGDNVPQLQATMANNRSKLSSLATVPLSSRSASHEADVVKLTSSISKDEAQVESLLLRRRCIQLYIWEELNRLWKRKSLGRTGVVGAWRSWCAEELVARSAERKAVEECWVDLAKLGV